MSDLLVGLLSAALATNPATALDNFVVEKTAFTVPAADPNDPVEKEYRKILEDDDQAEKDVLKWSDEAEARAKSDGGHPSVTLSTRIRQRLDEVKGEYLEFINHHPNHVAVRLAFGGFLNDTHDEEGAVVQWDKARELQPGNPAAWNNLANFYEHEGPVKKAFEYYSKAIALDGRQSVYYHNLAVAVYMFRKDARDYYHLNEQQVFDKALELYRKAIALDPDNFVLATDYAECFYGTNPPRWEDGLIAWAGALKIAHDEVERQGVYIHMARIQIRLGHYPEARANLELVTNPTYDVLRKRLVRNLDNTLRSSVTNAPVD